MVFKVVYKRIGEVALTQLGVSVKSCENEDLGEYVCTQHKITPSLAYVLVKEDISLVLRSVLDFIKSSSIKSKHIIKIGDGAAMTYRVLTSGNGMVHVVITSIEEYKLDTCKGLLTEFINDLRGITLMIKPGLSKFTDVFKDLGFREDNGVFILCHNHLDSVAVV